MKVHGSMTPTTTTKLVRVLGRIATPGLLAAAALGAGPVLLHADVAEARPPVSGDPPPNDPPPVVPPRERGGGAWQTGHVPASYVVLSVLYSPPGSSAQGAPKSSADYGSSSTTGTSASSSSSFKSGFGISASASILGGSDGTKPTGSGGGGSFDATKTSGSSTEETISKSTSTSIRVTGPAADGIDHNQDRIDLWLNPRLELGTRDGRNIAWALSNNGPSQIVQYVYVGWLKNPATLPPGVKAALDSAHITPADYPTILARDPFANGATTIDTNRFAITNTTFPYEPPYAAGSAGPAQTYAISNDLTVKSGTSASDSYSVGLQESLGFNLLIFSASVKSTQSWTWTNTSTQGDSWQSKQSASVTVTGPSYGYAGPTNVDVYYDRLYSSFFYAFQPLSTLAARPSSAAVRGAVVGADGKPVANEPVLMNVGGRTYRTFTGPRGEYYFYGARAPQATLTARGQTRPVGSGTTFNLR
ncbi:MAG: hypothetical protein HOO96_12765 [Polyangiaceae bacterium]|nr:hypothetical protein [Polyangiaceae bacterium]